MKEVVMGKIDIFPSKACVWADLLLTHVRHFCRVLTCDHHCQPIAPYVVTDACSVYPLDLRLDLSAVDRDTVSTR